MKSVKNKYLLLAITVGIAFSSCNTYSGLWSCMFGQNYGKNIAKKSLNFCKLPVAKNFGLLKLRTLKKVATFAAILLAGCFVINKIFSEDAPAPIYPDGNNGVGVISGANVSANNGQVNANALPQQAVLQRVRNLVDFARDSRCGLIVRDSGLISNVQFDVGNTQNKVYQLRVDWQINSTCGPRAIHNAHTLSRYFANNNGAFDNNINVLNDLHRTPSEFFGEIGEMLGERAHYSSTFFILQPQPVNLGGAHMQEIIDNYRRNDERLKIKETDLMEGYRESFNPELVVNERGENVPLGNKVNLINSLQDKNIGYHHSYVILNGQLERGDVANVSATIGHWISLVVVKTGANEYCWFILDSMNDNELINSDRLKAYMCKFLGQDHQLVQAYENLIKNNLAETRKSEVAADIKKIKDEVDAIKELNKDKKGTNFIIGEDLAKKEHLDDLDNKANDEILELDKVNNRKNILEKWLNLKIADLEHMAVIENPKEKEDLIAEINSLKVEIAGCTGFVIS